MKRILFLVLLYLLGIVGMMGQPNCVLTHYSSEQGLSQNSITCIKQDKNGILWLSTWDGINRFDGYEFKVYKASQNNQLALANNRIDIIEVDEYNMVWMQTYDNRVFRLNQATEQFELILPDGDRCENIKQLSNGHMWMMLKEEGAVCAQTDSTSLKVLTETYAVSHGHVGLNGRVHDIFLDCEGQEWLLTSNGLLKVDGENTVSYFSRTKERKGDTSQSFYAACCMGDTLYFASDRGRVWRYSMKDEIFSLWELPIEDRVIAVNELKGHGLLLTLKKQGLILYHPETGKCEIINGRNTAGYPEDAIRSVFVDSEQVAWFEMTEWGKTFRFKPKDKTIKVFRMQVEPLGADRSYPPFHICEDSVNHHLWVHPQGGGLAWYDRQADLLLPFYNVPMSLSWRFSNKLHTMLVDRQGNLWFCTHSKGLEKAAFYGLKFKIFPERQVKGGGLNETTVRALFQDAEGRLWISKRDGKIDVYNPQSVYLGYLTENGTISRTGVPLDGVAYQIMSDSKGRIWIATKGRGIICLNQEGARFAITRFEYDEDDIYSLSHNSVYCLHEDHNGRMWAATFGGGLNLLEETVDGGFRFINSRNNLKGYPIDECFRVRHIASDNQDNIWVGTTDGVLCFKKDFKNPEAIRFNHYKRDLSGSASLSSNNVYRILCTRNGDVYLATFGGGLNKVSSMDEEGNVQFGVYTQESGLASDILLSIEEDSGGNLWLSTENGLSKFIPEEQRFENYNDRDFGEKMKFEEATSLRLNSGSMVFGTEKGALQFFPQDIIKGTYAPPIYFSHLKISNKEVTPNDKDGILERIIDATDHLELSHQNNTLSISFAAQDYIYPENIRYAYCLEGFDAEWNYVGKQRTATYTNLPKGTYRFKVKSTNSDGIWVDNERVLRITVSPSFWETPWAIACYLVALILTFAVMLYILFTIYRLKHKVSVEQQVSDIKLQFFTNISHELRTPLTLIAGPVEYVMKNANLSDDVREQLAVVERNTDRMLRLVNQILDFRKIQKNKMKLRVEKMDVVPFVRRIMDNFEALAVDHHIDFMFESEKPSLELWVDSDKLEKIVFNLLSNAFKYTPQGKMITLFVHENENSVAIGVQDQGIGIPENKKASIFVRFENLIDKNLFNQQSSGIGLSLVKELVELHQATITVNSKVGEGSSFTVEFLKGKEHFGEDVELIVSDNIDGMDTQDMNVVSPMELHEESEKKLQGESERKSVLLVEDNLELKFFLRSIFAPTFDVYEAVNGVEGLDKAKKFVPDVIVSDIMMPEKDGLAMTRELRENFSTSHIPVILLTAKTDMDSKLQGIEQGADDYITKPFSASYLKAKVENILSRRSKLQHLYRANLMNEETMSDEEEMNATQSEMSSQDRDFMDRLVGLMEKNMDNGNLVVEDLVKELAVSRSVFFKKLKTLTGMAPIEFIREMRVKRAAQLIETGLYSMTQITYMVGINDPRYFSKCFKQYYGMTPTEYKEEKSTTKNK